MSISRQECRRENRRQAVVATRRGSDSQIPDLRRNRINRCRLCPVWIDPQVVRMKPALIMMLYALCASCMTEDADSFIIASGLQNIHTREQLIERDLQLVMASEGRSYTALADPVRTCLTDSAVSHAPQPLLTAADVFLAKKSEINWSTYRRVLDGEDEYLSPALLQHLTHQCEEVMVRAVNQPPRLALGNDSTQPSFTEQD
jgi:hypothetical protein